MVVSLILRRIPAFLVTKRGKKTHSGLYNKTVFLWDIYNRYTVFLFFPTIRIPFAKTGIAVTLYGLDRTRKVLYNPQKEGDSDGNESGLLNHAPQGASGFDPHTLRQLGNVFVGSPSARARQPIFGEISSRFTCPPKHRRRRKFSLARGFAKRQKIKQQFSKLL